MAFSRPAERGDGDADSCCDRLGESVLRGVFYVTSFEKSGRIFVRRMDKEILRSTCKEGIFWL